ncbi:hypothetical protein ABBQ38_004496 [Trebouxia sp. C0009 RCD-2024]
MDQEGQRPLQVGLIGAGLFTKDAYIPLCRRQLRTVQVRAIWSRSQQAAATLLASVQEFSPDASSHHGEEQLEQLLQDASIDAVIIVLPVQVMLKVAIQALRAGKHVLQEKPAANSVDAVNLAIKEYCTNFGRRVDNSELPVWALAENYRSEQGFRKASQLMPQLGTVIKIDLVADMPMNSSNKYFPSQWRRDAVACPGGFVMDSCVHHIAALRMLGRAAGLGEVEEASATATSISKELPPPDTLVGSVKFASGTCGGVSITFAGSVLRFSLSLTGTQGSLEVLRGGWGGPKPGYTLSYQTATSGSSHVEQVPFSGLDDELTAFVQQVHASKNGNQESDSDAAYRISIQEGAKDLAVVEALLESSKQSGKTVSVKHVP